MENLIIGILKPLELQQSLYAVKDGNKLETLKVSTKDFVEKIFELSKKHGISQIALIGPTHYTKGFIPKMREIGKTSYSKDDIIDKFKEEREGEIRIWLNI